MPKNGQWACHPGGRLNIKMPSYQYRDPMFKIRWSRDHLIFNMGIPIPGKDSLFIEMGPRWPLLGRLKWYSCHSVRPLQILSRWNLWVPGLEISYSHFTNMGGYQDSNSRNDHQVTWPFVFVSSEPVRPDSVQCFGVICSGISIAEKLWFYDNFMNRNFSADNIRFFQYIPQNMNTDMFLF